MSSFFTNILTPSAKPVTDKVKKETIPSRNLPKITEDILPLFPNYEFSLGYKPDFELNNRIVLWLGDITRLEISAVVNSTNSNYYSSTGVSKAINLAAGPKLLEVARGLPYLNPGAAVVTTG